METLILNTLQGYLLVGGFLAIFSGLTIQTVNTSLSFTFKDILAVTLTWPFVIGVLVTDYLNGEF